MDKYALILMLLPYSSQQGGAITVLPMESLEMCEEAKRKWLLEIPQKTDKRPFGAERRVYETSVAPRGVCVKIKS